MVVNFYCKHCRKSLPHSVIELNAFVWRYQCRACNRING